ncbi:MAG: CPBP family intramembrane metalloprotease [Actinobacteria bacterium]|nr:MAG: CPBP family intramembrane metalloprotease [Actinomycetota bacterium]RIK06197.1 MAG: hypothetical protein DCC48_07130 [Acidobacteriota bacterium]
MSGGDRQRPATSRPSTALVSAFFGLWHVAVETRRVGLDAEPWAVLPALLATAGASAFVPCPLRRGTDSIVAPMMVHTAVNAAVLLAVSA